MSTRSSISVKSENGDIYTIYCHNNGYIEHGVGDILKTYYNDYNTIQKLIDGGDLSVLGKNIDPDPSISHSFNKPQKDTCIYYMRDRGEKGCNARRYTSEIIMLKSEAQGYDYLYKDGTWFIKRKDWIEF